MDSHEPRNDGDLGRDARRQERRERRAERRRERRNDGSRTTRIGAVLVIVGGLALLSDLGFFTRAHNVVGMVLFAVLGALALSHYLARRNPGSLVGAFALFGLAAATVGGESSGFYFLALLGIGFAALYYLDRGRWWAIIPAGTLVSVAFVAGLDAWRPGYDASWVLFLGLAATFGVLYRLPDDPKPWAIYPLVACLVLALLGLSFGGGWVLPLALVALGVYLLMTNAGGWRGALRGGSARQPGAGAAGPGPASQDAKAPGGEARSGSEGDGDDRQQP